MPVWAASTEGGEFGADLVVLRRLYVPPQSQDESNHYFDLFGGARFHQALLDHDLTNNRALIVLSHGKGITWNGLVRYGYYPGNRVWREDTIPYFSASDICRVIGVQAAAQIHNIMIAGCNKENAFDPAELRRWFVNATNITHAPSGKDGYELVFRHTFTHGSSDISLLYSASDDFMIGGIAPAAEARKLGLVPYVAHLYRPGEPLAFATKIAGRELLDPSMLDAAAATPELRLSEPARQIVTAAQNKLPVLSAGGGAESPFSAESALFPAERPTRDSSGAIRRQTSRSEQNARPVGRSTNDLIRWEVGSADR